MTVDDVPQTNLNYYTAAAWAAMPWDKADHVWDKLKHGAKLALDVDEDRVVVSFKDGTPFVSMSLAQVLTPPPEFEYAK